MTRRPPALLLSLVLVAALFAAGSALAAGNSPCGAGVESIRVADGWLCTHGNDVPPAGVDTTELPSVGDLLEARFGEDSMPEVVAATEGGEDALTAAATVACAGDGTSGPRTQLIYARASNVANRYSSVLPLLRQYAADADDQVNVSASRVGQGRRIRYVTNVTCEPEIMNVTLTESGDDTFSNMISELQAKGLTSPDRKYVVFMDAAVGICGLGQVYLNDRGDQLNPNNTGRAMFARVDTSCWQHALAHEMLHTMGAVQNSAPNSSGAGHCTDEIDVMCYRDTANTVIRQVCGDRAGTVDCNNDDYFHPNPRANSYLDNKWNVARSRYLAGEASTPLPAVTTVSIPASGHTGIGWSVRADVSTEDATVVWSSTRDECWFANPQAKSTTWTCPAGTVGEAQVSVMVTENGIMTPYMQDVEFTIPAAPIQTAVTMTPSDSSTVSGQTIKLNGTVTQASTMARIAGLQVRVSARPKGSNTWTRIGDAVTNRSGAIHYEVAPTRNMYYRFTNTGTNVWDTSNSTAQLVNVKARMTTKLNSKLVAGLYTRTARTTRISGTISPNKAGQKVQLKRYRDGRWRVIKEKRITSRSRFSFDYTPRRSGRHLLMVVKPADRRNVRTTDRITIRAS